MRQHTQDGLPKQRGKGMVCECPHNSEMAVYAYDEHSLKCYTCGLPKQAEAGVAGTQSSAGAEHQAARRAAAVKYNAKG